MLHMLYPLLIAHLLRLGASLELVRLLGKNPSDCQIQYGTAAVRSWLHSVHRSEPGHVCGFLCPAVVPEGTGQGIWSTLNSSQMLTSFSVSHQMATIFVVNIGVGGGGWTPGPADEVTVFGGATWNQVCPAKPCPVSYRTYTGSFPREDFPQISVNCWSSSLPCSRPGGVWGCGNGNNNQELTVYCRWFARYENICLSLGKRKAQLVFL